jgi:hypothetical protein
MKRLRNSLLFTLLMASAYMATAQTVPPEMNFQGLLVDSADQPLEGNQDLTFRIFDQTTGGTLKWGPQTKAVVVYQGQFNTVLGPTDEGGRPLIDAFMEPSCFLEIQAGSNTPIQPRQQILSAPFALNSTLLDGQGWNVVFDNGDPATGKIDGAKLADGSVTSLQLGAAAVVAENLAPDAINTGTIVDGGVTSADILDGTITTADIQNGTITSADLAAGAVTLSAMAPNSVNSSSVVDSSITSADIAANTITASDIATGAVGSDEILNGAVTSSDIDDGTIQQEDVGTLYRLSANDGDPLSALYVDSSGNVGIGTTTPPRTLSVVGTAQFLGSLDSTPTAGLRARSSVDFDDYGIRYYASSHRPTGGVYFYGSQEGAGPTVRMEHNTAVNAFVITKNGGGYLSISGGNQLRLNGSATHIDSASIRMNSLPTGSATPLHIGSTGYLTKQSSSERYKENIEAAREDFQKVLSLEPKTFNYKSEPDGPTLIGYIAEEVDDAGLSAVTVYDEQGRPDAVDYSRLVIYSNEILKKHQATIQEQQQRIDILESELESLKEMVRTMTNQQ